MPFTQLTPEEEKIVAQDLESVNTRRSGWTDTHESCPICGHVHVYQTASGSISRTPLRADDDVKNRCLRRTNSPMFQQQGGRKTRG